jgi:hypothetical protein
MISLAKMGRRLEIMTSIVLETISGLENNLSRLSSTPLIARGIGHCNTLRYFRSSDVRLLCIE